MCKVVALSAPHHATAVYNPTKDLVAYAAGCFAVVCDSTSQEQQHHFRSTTSNQPLQCVAWSHDGQHLAAGEAGSNARVYVWKLSSGQCACELKGHKHTVASLCFSSHGRLSNAWSAWKLAGAGCGAWLIHGCWCTSSRVRCVEHVRTLPAYMKLTRVSHGPDCTCSAAGFLLPQASCWLLLEPHMMASCACGE